MAPMQLGLLAATLSGSALALNGHHPRHADFHKRSAASSSSSSVAVPYSYGNSSAPHAAAVTGVDAAAPPEFYTTHTKVTKTVYVTESGDAAPSTTDATDAGAQNQPQVKNVVYTNVGAADEDTCKSPSVVTVTATATETVHDTATVTVTAAAAGQDSSSTTSDTSTSSAIPTPVQKWVQGSGRGGNRGGRGSRSWTDSASWTWGGQGGYGGDNDQGGSPATSAAAGYTSPQGGSQAPPATSAQQQPPVYSTSAPAQPDTDEPVPTQAPVQTYSQPASAPAYTQQSTSKTSQALPSNTAPATCKRAASKKKGCLATKDNVKNCVALQNAGANMFWHYDWELASSDMSGMEYVPMMHSVDGDWLPWLQQSAAAKTAAFKMNVNEPMIVGQAAAGRLVAQSEVEALYEAFKAAGNPDATILSPSICGNQMGIDWLKAFDQAQFEIVNAHYYEDCTSIQSSSGMDDYLSKVAAAFPGKQIWVTELGCHPNGASQSQIKQFMAASISALENNAKVDRYAWFKADGDNDLTVGTLFLADDTSMSPYGQSYVTAGC